MSPGALSIADIYQALIFVSGTVPSTFNVLIYLNLPQPYVVGIIIIPISQMREFGPKRLSNLPEVRSLRRDRAGLWTELLSYRVYPSQYNILILVLINHSGNLKNSRVLFCFVFICSRVSLLVKLLVRWVNC